MLPRGDGREVPAGLAVTGPGPILIITAHARDRYPAQVVPLSDSLTVSART